MEKIKNVYVHLVYPLIESDKNNGGASLLIPTLLTSTYQSDQDIYELWGAIHKGSLLYFF